MGERVRAGKRGFLLAVFFIGSAHCLQADQPAETLPGFTPNNVFETHGIDNVNLFNGDPGLVVPLGPEYPIGPGNSWQLKAYYSAKFWKFDNYQCTIQTIVRHAFVSGYPTLGAGWSLELGYVSTDDIGESAATGIYHSPDGGRHPFYGTSPYYTKDGSFLRISKPTSTSYQVEFPDGTRHVFSQAYSRPRPTSGTSFDFNDLNWGGANSTTPRYGLKTIENAFNTTLLRVDYVIGTAWKVDKVVLNPGQSERSVSFKWGSQQVGTVTWPVLSSITFPGVGTRALVVDFVFLASSSFPRNSYDNSVALQSCINPGTVFVPLLQTINFSDSSVLMSYGFGYQLSSPFAGTLIRITLPTKGIIDYVYAATTLACFGNIGCTTDLETNVGSGFSEAPLAPDPERDDMSRYWDSSAAVIQRTETDPYTSVTSTVLYDRYQQVPLDGQGKPIQSKITRRVIVTAPSGSPAADLVTKHLFHVEVGPALGGTGIELVRRYYADTNASGTPVRSLVNCHEADGSGPVCGYQDTFGNLQAYSLGDNVRRQAQVTWYGENPTGGGTCSSGGTDCTASANTGYDSLAGKYDSNTITTALSGVFRTSTTNWAPSVDATRWLLDLLSSRTISDTGSLSPSIIPTSYTFSTSTGFLQQVSVSDGANGTLTRVFAPDSVGNPQTETITGTAGLSGQFTDTRTFQSGLVTSTRRTGISWSSFDVTRDPDTGLITQSRDANGLVTLYDYDALGRITSITPPGGELPTKICYLAAVTGNPAFTIAKKSSGDPCQRDDGIPATGSGEFNGYQFDGFGRLIREIRRLPNALSTGSYFSKRETRYDGAGHRAFVSELSPCPISSYPGTSISNCAFPVPQASTGLTGTAWSNFDPFGRAQAVTRADGSTTTVSYADGSVAFSDTLESVAVNNVSGSAATTATRKDVLGRVVSVDEPSISGMRGDTSYRYNALDKLAEVKQPLDAVNSQLRTFNYDAFGFLRSETHPEKGTASYGGYDAMGNALSKTEGSVASTFVYDAAGRLTRQIAAGVSYLTNCYDGASTCADGNAGFSGGTYKLGRLTRRYGFNPRSPRQPRVTEDFTYALATGAGLSRKTTVYTNAPHAATPAINETWTYNSLGLVSAYGLPFAGTTPDVTASIEYASGVPTRLVSTTPAGSQTLVNSSQYNPSAGLASWTAGSPNNLTVTIEQEASLMPRPRRISTTGFDTGIFSYDGAGNVTAIGSDLFTYDVRSRVKTGLARPFSTTATGT